MTAHPKTLFTTFLPATDSKSADEDCQLMKKVQAYDQQAFEILVQRHSQRFYQLAFKKIKDHQMAEDIVQDAFIKLWKKPHQFKVTQNIKFTTWFYKVIENQTIDYQRKQFRQAATTMPTFECAPQNPETDLENHYNAQYLDTLISQLPSKQRQAVSLYINENLSHEKASQIMHLSLQAFQSLLMRGKQKLKKIHSKQKYNKQSQ